MNGFSSGVPKIATSLAALGQGGVSADEAKWGAACVGRTTAKPVGPDGLLEPQALRSQAKQVQVGFDTYLTIDGQIALMWRKHAGVLPRLLFRHDQSQVELIHPGGESPEVQATFTATAAEALSNLADAGFGWNATVAAYDEVRIVGGFSSGMFEASHFRDHGDDGRIDFGQIRLARQEFDSYAPDRDLHSLGRVMAHDWTKSGGDEVLILSSLSYDGDLPPGHELASAALDIAIAADLPEPFAAARAAESLALLDRAAPLLLWPMALCIFIAHLPPSAELVLDLSQDAEQSVSDPDFVLADYPNHYWESATESLAGQARLMGRLWGVLASFDNQLGREYWFARAAELLEGVRSSRLVEAKVPPKVKGDALESLTAALLKTEEPELTIIERNLRTASEEIDILVTNSLSDPFWTAQRSPLLLIECKNWASPVGINELRVFESKMRDRGALCRLGVFVSMSGFTKPFLERLPQFQVSGGLIFVVDGIELASIVARKIRLTDWLRTEGIRRSLGKRPPRQLPDRPES